MCLYSREHQTREIQVGEQGQIGPIGSGHNPSQTGGGNQGPSPGSGNNPNFGVLPNTLEQGIACLCVKNGYVLRLAGIPQAAMNKHGLVSDTAIVVFLEGQGKARTTRTRDRVKFDNTSQAPLSDLSGAKVTCLATSMAGYLAVQNQEAGVPEMAEAGGQRRGVGVIAGGISLLAFAAAIFR